MNNDLLAGILVGLPGELPLRVSGNGNNTSEAGAFMTLLRDRIADESATGMSIEARSSKRDYSFAGINDLNPLMNAGLGSPGNRARNDQLKATDRADAYSEKTFEPVQSARSNTATLDRNDSAERNAESRHEEKAEKLQQNSKEEATAETANDEAASNESGESVVLDNAAVMASEVAEKPLNESDLAAAAVEENETTDNTESILTAKNRQEAIAKEIARLEKLLSTFSPEEKAALIEALQQLSPEDLDIMAESSDEFCQQLVELVNRMPDSAEKDELLAMVESPEFMKLIQAMANQQNGSEDVTPALPVDLEVVQTSAETARTAESKTKINTEEDEESARQNISQIADANEIANGNAVASSEADPQESSEKAQDQTDDRREAAKTTDEKNVETQQESVSPEPKSGKESLREEFKRQNQATDGVTGDSQQPEMTEESTLASKSSSQTTVAQPASPEQVKAVVEEAAKKFFALFTAKASGGDRMATAETYSPDAVKRHSGMSNNSAGNGGNGFSSQTGTPASSMSSARPATPAPVANQIFSQMLEKAEYLKTQNGSKVLNMEFDPGDLGKLEMELTSRDGTVSARISAESALAKAQLEELAPQIKEQLLSQGVNLTEITVDISSRNPDESNRDQMSGGKSKSTRILAAEKEAAEAIIRKNILPNLRRAALNIKAVDLTV